MQMHQVLVSIGGVDALRGVSLGIGFVQGLFWDRILGIVFVYLCRIPLVQVSLIFFARAWQVCWSWLSCFRVVMLAFAGSYLRIGFA